MKSLLTIITLTAFVFMTKIQCGSCLTMFEEIMSTLGQKLQSGLQFVNTMLKMDSSGNIFKLILTNVQKSFAPKPRGETFDSIGEGNIPHEKSFFEKIAGSFGLNSEKLNAIALNIAIFAAQVIENLLRQKTDSRDERQIEESSFLQWLLEQPKISRMLNSIQDRNLPGLVINEIQERTSSASNGENECVKLLICKASPFVWGMQNSLKYFLDTIKGRQDSNQKRKGDTGPRNNGGGNNSSEQQTTDDVTAAWRMSSPIDRLFLFLPTFQDVFTYGDFCDQQFPNCKY